MIALAESTTPLVERPSEEITSVVSASRLNCFHSCRLRFYFRYVLELETVTSPALLVGKAVHAAIEAWNQRRWRGLPSDSTAIQSAFMECWTAIASERMWQADEEQAQRDRSWGLAEMYFRESPIPPDEKPEAVEAAVEADLSRFGLPTLVGIIDLVRPGGVIVDFKTSTSVPDARRLWLNHRNQLTIYALLYRESTGRREGGIELHHLVKTKLPKLVVSRFEAISPHDENQLFRTIESFVDGVERGDYVPSPGLQCMHCEYLSQCVKWRGGTR